MLLELLAGRPRPPSICIERGQTSCYADRRPLSPACDALAEATSEEDASGYPATSIPEHLSMSLRKFAYSNVNPTGNLQQYVTRRCWDFREEIQRKYGRVVLLHGLFGVRLALP